MFLRAAIAVTGVALLLVPWSLGCAEDTRDPDCVAAIQSADRCDLDTSTFTCPDAGEADAFESCGYPCFSGVQDCAEFTTPGSPWGVCLSECIAKYGSPPPDASPNDVD